MANRPGDDGRSALDHVALAADRLDAAADSVRAALVNQSHRIDTRLLGLEPGGPPAHSASLDTELGRVETAGSRLATVIDDADAGQWLKNRSTDSGASATPLEVVQAAVAFVLDRLKAAERTLREVRGHPS